MRIKLKCTLLQNGENIPPGEIVDLPRKRAEALVRRGWATPLTKELRVGVSFSSDEEKRQ